MLQGASRFFAMQRWFKITAVKLADCFTVGKSYVEDRVVTPDMTNNRAHLGSYVVSTPALVNSLLLLAGAVVEDTLPDNLHALTRHAEIWHREPLLVGEEMRMELKVSHVEDDAISFDMRITKEAAQRVVAEGNLKLKVIQTEKN